MPSLVEEVMKEDIEEKYNINLTQQYVSEGKQMKQEDDGQYFQEPETYTPIREEFPGCYNFQFSLANQDSSKHWVVSVYY